MDFYGFDSLKVYYDGKTNVVFHRPDLEYTYAVGEMLLDAMEMPVSAVGDAVLRSEHLNDEPTEENLKAAVHDALDGLTIESPVQDLLVKILFAEECGMNYMALQDKKPFMEKVTTVGGIMKNAYEDLTAELDDYNCFLTALVNVDAGRGTEAEQELVDHFRKLFRGSHEIQHIDYEIIFDEEAESFMSVYSIDSLISLMAFEYCHLKETGTSVKQCKNCGRYFIPENRSDTLYCSRISPQDKRRTCRQIGAQIAMHNKLEMDATARAYRKKYQSLNMAYQRGQDGVEKEHHLQRREQFKNEGQRKKKDLASGCITAEEFIRWCEEYV